MYYGLILREDWCPYCGKERKSSLGGDFEISIADLRLEGQSLSLDGAYDLCILRLYPQGENLKIYRTKKEREKGKKEIESCPTCGES